MGASHVLSLGNALELAVGTKYVVRPVTTIGHNKLEERISGIKLDALSQRYQLIQKATAKYLATMTVQIMPGCCGVVVLHSFSGDVKACSEFIDAGLNAAQKEGFGLVVYTLRQDSELGKLRNHPARRINLFRNGKTDNLVWLFEEELAQEPRKPKTPTTAGE